MQLKTITIKGFKSFPEKTTLKFDEGITAIVGPNGSGKSNIIEAIRWVMGEQSAKTLRGDRMNDVIFSGTHERKPLNIAEVEIVLDNSDNYLDIEFEEVSVLRRISRTGDSTYMINQKECRLKDIVDLFMDSGLGKESFSIISQGQVEAVFNSKPEERRGIFEEAAGVFKYKVRKKDAEKKLNETQENLDRVQDIIYELESQLEPLRKQSDIARSYLNQKIKLVDLDIGVTVWQIKDLLKTIDKEKKEHKNVSNEIEEMNTQITELEEKEESLQLNINDLENTREKLNTELVNVVREKERTEASLNLFIEKAHHREVFKSEKEDSIRQISNKIQSLEDELKHVNQSFKEKNAELSNLSNRIKDIEQKQDYLEGDRDTKIEKLRSHYIELLQRQTSLKNNFNHLEQEITRSQKTGEKNQGNLTTLENELESIENLLKEKKLNYEKTSSDLLDLLNDYKNLESSVNNSVESIRVKNERVSKTSSELERMKAKQTSLTEMQENYAGYYAGVRAVMQQKETLNGIVGTVAELIQIRKDYIQAIDTVLSSSGQFIVVEDEKAGRDAIKYLKDTKSGRATFLPLTTIKPRFIPHNTQMKIKDIAGFVGIASDLVTYDTKIQNIVENLLGQTIVAETLEAANKIAAAIQYRNRVVSLDGDIINAGGSMTGGGSRHNNTSPIFTQKAELDSLSINISESEKVLEQLTINRDKDKEELDKTEEKLREVRESGETTRLEEQKLKSEIDNLETQLSRLERELKVTTFEASENTEYIENQQARKKEIEQEMETVAQAINECDRQMKLLSSEKENIEAEKSKLNQELLEVNEERNQIREILASARTNKESLVELIEDYTTQMNDLKEEISLFDQDLKLDSKEDLEKRLADHEQYQSEVEKDQSATREKLTELNGKLKELKKELNHFSGRHKYLTEQKNKLDVQLSRNDVKLDHHLSYLVDEYKIGFEEAKLLDEPDMELAEAQKQVRLLKKGIEELGPVNLNSIDEYKHVNERYQFLSTQQNDLIEAKANLYNTMDEMDAIVEKQFKETFDQIHKEFALVFPKMFGGGYAELVLSDPDNLLETGIEIIAQPPGKRLTRLSLLSGGERALTAISLLFAIIQVNPIPFCILDEAEAALDDANVDRFGRYLTEFEKDTQFIVITHRKGTMEHADQLYGVTMQEKGISKIVAVSLTEAQEFEGVN